MQRWLTARSLLPQEYTEFLKKVERSSRPPSHVIYTEHLSKKDRGHALWLPDPALDLPDEYREEGVCIGDVGIMDPSGAFIFLFNINKPAEHPVNCDRPSEFQPLDPPLQQDDITETQVFSAGSFLASPFVKRVKSDTLKGYGHIFNLSTITYLKFQRVCV